MPLIKGENALADIAEADVYFDTRLNKEAWTGADASTKAAALVTATDIFNELNWVGVAVTEMMPFPREGCYFDPRAGVHVTLDSSIIPVRALNGLFELAHHLIVNPDALEHSSQVKSLGIKGIALNNIKQAPLIPDQVLKGIRPLLRNSSRSWWRAN